MNDWQVRERFVCGKAQAVELCEDLLVDTPRFVGVIDSSSGFPARSGEDSHTTIGRLIGIEFLRALETAGPSASVYDIVKAAARRVAALKSSRGYTTRHTGGCFFCVMDLVNYELWRPGDCWYLLDTFADKPTLTAEAPLSELRSAYLWALRLAGASDEDLIREQPERTLVAEYLKVKDFFANSAESDRGYGVINGDEVPQAFIERLAIPPTARALAMGTDGYPRCGHLLAQVEGALTRALIDDPLMIDSHRAPTGLTPGTISYDDRAFISLERAVQESSP